MGTNGPVGSCELSVKITSQNVQGLTENKESELISLCKQKEITVGCLQETHRLENNEIENGQYTIINHSSGSKRQGGIGFVLSPTARTWWDDAGNVKKNYGNRILSIRLKTEDAHGRTIYLTIISAYAPPKTQDNEWYIFNTNLNKCYDAQKYNDVVITGMDGNAQIGTAHQRDDNVCGNFGIQTLNAKGIDLRNTMSQNEMCSSASYYDKPYHSTFSNHHGPRCLDYLFVRRRDLVRVKDACPVKWYGVTSDHRAVYIKVKLAVKLKKRTNKTSLKKRYLGALRDDSTREKFQQDVLEGLNENAKDSTEQDDSPGRRLDVLQECTQSQRVKGWNGLIKKRASCFHSLRNEIKS
jgi:exonuclease III